MLAKNQALGFTEGESYPEGRRLYVTGKIGHRDQITYLIPIPT